MGYQGIGPDGHAFQEQSDGWLTGVAERQFDTARMASFPQQAAEISHVGKTQLMTGVFSPHTGHGDVATVEVQRGNRARRVPLRREHADDIVRTESGRMLEIVETFKELISTYKTL